MLTITLTMDGGSVIFDVMEADAKRVMSRIEKMMEGYIVARQEVH